MMSGSHTAKRRLPDGPNPEQTPVEKRPTIRRELPADMPPEFAQSYRQKQELLAKMFADARQLLQMESNHCKNSTCKYGNICTGMPTYGLITLTLESFSTSGVRVEHNHIDMMHTTTAVLISRHEVFAFPLLVRKCRKS